MTLAVIAALVLAGAVSSLRWMRIAQREHYLAGSALRFALRWWRHTPTAVGVGTIGVVSAGLVPFFAPAGFITAAVVAVGPPGLALRGRTSPLAWTSRLKRLMTTVGLLLVSAAIVGWYLDPVIAAAAALFLPILVDGALVLLAPLERRLATPWVEDAAATLRDSGATVVAITGSYGKTSTKGYVAQLLRGSRRVLASPASFNNRMGLARAINENLAGGVDVFVAEMGTYGPGEIAELCAWIPPDVAVITAIGPVHLERFGTVEAIVDAKSEILVDGAVAVLNVDDARLAALADRESARRRVVRVGTGEDHEVSVRDGKLLVGGATVATVPASCHATNVACAVGVGIALGLDPDEIAPRVPDLTEPEHRLTTATSPSGVLVIDDTYNSNPAGAEAALAALDRVDAAGRRVVVTPGMVELGSRQSEENRAFGVLAARAADQVIVVGQTNRASLVAGVSDSGSSAIVVGTREEAVEWVRANLGPGDAVLYENDLPDHFP